MRTKAFRKGTYTPQKGLVVPTGHIEKSPVYLA